MTDGAGLSIVDSRALADEDTHRNNRTFFNDDTFDNFGTCADKTTVLDNRG